jgi:hypothetical protein
MIILRSLKNESGLAKSCDMPRSEQQESFKGFRYGYMEKSLYGADFAELLLSCYSP